MLLSILVQFATGLALLALLAQSYGVVRRRVVSADWAPVLLGTLFGIVAFVEMHRPISPIDGVIIDLRNIPVALAGAFLGWRGMLPCLLITVLGRYGIGGVGTASALLGMGISGLAGIIWARRTACYPTRNLAMLLGLGFAMSLHLFSVLLLPTDVAAWYFAEAAAPILIANLVGVVAIGTLLERENRKIDEDNRLKAAATRDPHTGLLTAPAFVRDVTSAFAMHPFGSFAGLIEISPRCDVLHCLMSKTAFSCSSYVLDRQVLSGHFVHANFAGRTAHDRILVPITMDEAQNADKIATDLSRDESGDLSRCTPFTIKVVHAPDPAQFLKLVEAAVLTSRPTWSGTGPFAEADPLKPGQRTAVRRATIFDPLEHDTLFNKAEFLIKRQRSS